MSGIGDMANGFLHSDEGEKLSDGALAAAADRADSATGDRYKDQIEKAEQAADGRIGQ